MLLRVRRRLLAVGRKLRSFRAFAFPSNRKEERKMKGIVAMQMQKPRRKIRTIVATMSLVLVPSLGCQSTGGWPSMGLLGWNSTPADTSRMPKPPSTHFTQGRGFSPSGKTRVADNSGFPGGGSNRNGNRFGNNSSTGSGGRGTGAQKASFSDVGGGRSNDQFSQSGPYPDGQSRAPRPVDNPYTRAGRDSQSLPSGRQWNSQNSQNWRDGTTASPSGAPHPTQWNTPGQGQRNSSSGGATNSRSSTFGGSNTGSEFRRLPDRGAPTGNSSFPDRSSIGSGSRAGQPSGIGGGSGARQPSGIGGGGNSSGFGGSRQPSVNSEAGVNSGAIIGSGNSTRSSTPWSNGIGGSKLPGGNSQRSSQFGNSQSGGNSSIDRGSPTSYPKQGSSSFGSQPNSNQSSPAGSWAPGSTGSAQRQSVPAESNFASPPGRQAIDSNPANSQSSGAPRNSGFQPPPDQWNR